MNKTHVMPESEEEVTKISAELLRITVQLMVELHPRRPGSSTIDLDSSIDRDLGLDSLGRVELFSRIERAFVASLPEQLLVGAETPRDLLRALLASQGRSPAFKVPVERQEAPVLDEAAPQSVTTLTGVLDWHCRTHQDRTHIIFCNESGEEEAISYAALRRRAGEIAHGLLHQGLEPGQTVAIMLPTCPDYFYSFFGVLLGGGIPVPIYPPARLSQIEDHLRRHTGILANAQVKILITIPEALTLARLLKSQVGGLRAVMTPQEFNPAEGNLPQFPTSPQDTVLLQYTSGSTGNPKGVVLSHANLLANIRAMGQVAGVTSRDVFVSWLPLYHDMGLIGAWLGSLFYATPLVIMSPLTFLARPEQWLWAIHRHRGTLSAAPNFAYELCLRRIDENSIQGLDLSSWRMAYNGAEPVSPATMNEFRERFAAHGFRPAAVAPVYGLAESSVGLAFPPQERGLLVDLVKSAEFLASGHAIPAGPLDNETLRFVACGQPLPGHQVRIVDRTGHELPERVEGRLEFKGPSATSGYFRNPEETRRLFRGTWLDSGDLAYLADGDIYVTGRAKDVIIKAGRNIYPYELEEMVGSLPGIRKGCVAVFGSPDPVSGSERLIVLAETRETTVAALDKLRTQINELAFDLLGTPPDDIALAPPHTVLKTSSGKIRRAASRQFYKKGGSASRPSPVWLQLSRLVWTGALAQTRRLTSGAVEILYAGYLWGLFSGIALIAWLAVCLMPHQGWSWLVSRTAARLFLRLAGIPVTVNGLDNLPENTPCILAVNHASYLDGLVLVAALPGRNSFVAKGELKKNMISRLYLQRIGCEFVERFDFQQGVEDTDRIQRSVANGRSMIFFPEGTFRRMPGLLPFKMGAFLVGAQARAPVVPVAIRGTRSILQPDHWFPRKGSVIISIGSQLLENDTDWNAALRLKDAARAEILRHCGEPDLSGE